MFGSLAVSIEFTVCRHRGNPGQFRWGVALRKPVHPGQLQIAAVRVLGPAPGQPHAQVHALPAQAIAHCRSNGVRSHAAVPQRVKLRTERQVNHRELVHLACTVAKPQAIVPAEPLVGLLRTHAIDTVIDVRSSPYSRFVPHCNRESLAALLTAHGLAYVWAGEALGGRPADASCYHGGEVKIGKVDYAQVAQRPWFQRGLHTLMATAAGQRAALLCSEEDPRRCHRHKLIAHALRDQGVRVLHIRHSGELEESDTLDCAAPTTGCQQLLLGGFPA